MIEIYIDTLLLAMTITTIMCVFCVGLLVGFIFMGFLTILEK